MKIKVSEIKTLYPLFLLLCTLFLSSTTTVEASKYYDIVNLTTNSPGGAPNTDSNLVNPWGLTFDRFGHLFIADNGNSLATSYSLQGVPLAFILNVNSTPTGMVRNPYPADFKVGTAPLLENSEFLFCTEAGTILAFNPFVNQTNAVVVADHSAFNAVYKGLTIASHEGHRFLYVADFFNAKVDVFDSSFNYVGHFTDRDIPDGYGPFNIRNIDGQLYVSYAKQQAPDYTDDLPGPGNGFVDIFSTSGKRIKRLISRGHLNAPWGLALAPDNFGKFSKALLVGNFGDGFIHAYHHKSGHYIGALHNKLKQPIVIDGLWSLEFGGKHEKHALLYFTAGPNDESGGLLGYIQPIASE